MLIERYFDSIKSFLHRLTPFMQWFPEIGHFAAQVDIESRHPTQIWYLADQIIPSFLANKAALEQKEVAFVLKNLVFAQRAQLMYIWMHLNEFEQAQVFEALDDLRRFSELLYTLRPKYVVADEIAQILSGKLNQCGFDLNSLLSSATMSQGMSLELLSVVHQLSMDKMFETTMITKIESELGWNVARQCVSIFNMPGTLKIIIERIFDAFDAVHNEVENATKPISSNTSASLPLPPVASSNLPSMVSSSSSSSSSSLSSSKSSMSDKTGPKSIVDTFIPTSFEDMSQIIAQIQPMLIESQKQASLDRALFSKNTAVAVEMSKFANHTLSQHHYQQINMYMNMQPQSTTTTLSSSSSSSSSSVPYPNPNSVSVSLSSQHQLQSQLQPGHSLPFTQPNGEFSTANSPLLSDTPCSPPLHSNGIYPPPTGCCINVPHGHYAPNLLHTPPPVAYAPTVLPSGTLGSGVAGGNPSNSFFAGSVPPPQSTSVHLPVFSGASVPKLLPLPPKPSSYPGFGATELIDPTNSHRPDSNEMAGLMKMFSGLMMNNSSSTSGNSLNSSSSHATSSSSSSPSDFNESQMLAQMLQGLMQAQNGALSEEATSKKKPKKIKKQKKLVAKKDAAKSKKPKAKKKDVEPSNKESKEPTT